MHALFTTLALSTLVAATPAAAAQPDEESFSVAISYADLDVVSDAGLTTLLHRVNATANRVCVGVGDSPLQQALQAQRCRANVRHSAERDLWSREPASGGMRISAR
jgi:UrcA family protein